MHAGKGETIFALASGRGRSAVAVIRISGPHCLAALSLAGGKLPKPRYATLRTLSDPQSNEELDRAIVINFPGPQSFTGENMLEFQVTGAPAVINGVLAALSKVDGLRPAEQGEFARRAFEAGKMDLSEVEGLADLIEAETSEQRRRALRIAGGALRRESDEIRGLVIKGAAAIEAQLDFGDVEDTDAMSSGAQEVIGEALERVRKGLGESVGAERLRDGLVVAIVGLPNAGKSTLMNVLARRDVSIVSAIPGTTRDVIEVALELRGFPVLLLDTAGIRATDDGVELEGVARARKRAETADLVLWLAESGAAFPPDELAPERVILVATKMDLRQQEQKADFAAAKWLEVSALTGKGVPELLDEVARFAAQQLAPTCSALLTRERHRSAFRSAERALARSLLHRDEDADLAAEDLRLAARALERVSGRIEVEEILDEVFARLCVGK